MQREIETFLARIAAEKAGCLDLLARPKDKSAFGYGQASGILQGLDRAEQLLNIVIEEEADDESH